MSLSDFQCKPIHEETPYIIPKNYLDRHAGLFRLRPTTAGLREHQYELSSKVFYRLIASVFASGIRRLQRTIQLHLVQHSHNKPPFYPPPTQIASFLRSHNATAVVRGSFKTISDIYMANRYIWSSEHVECRRARVCKTAIEFWKISPPETPHLPSGLSLLLSLA